MYLFSAFKTQPTQWSAVKDPETLTIELPFNCCSIEPSCLQSEDFQNSIKQKPCLLSFCSNVKSVLAKFTFEKYEPMGQN